MIMKLFYSALSITALSILVISCKTIPEENPQKKISAAKIHDQLGMIYLERKDSQRAKQKFLLALDLAPTIPETWYSYAYYLEHTGNIDSARTHYEKALHLAPRRGDVLNNYGTFLCRIGDYQQAINYFLKAAQDQKYMELAAAYENAGLCSLKIPNYKQAKVYFSKALAEDSNRATALMELAQLNFRLSNYQESRKLLYRFLATSTPTIQSLQLERKLDAVKKIKGVHHA